MQYFYKTLIWLAIIVITVLAIIKDKKYFVILIQSFKKKMTRYLLMSIGLVALFITVYLYTEEKIISQNVFMNSFLGITIIGIAIIYWVRMKKLRDEKTFKIFRYDCDSLSITSDESLEYLTENTTVSKHDFDPLSLGILFFSFALSLWTSLKAEDTFGIYLMLFMTMFALVFLFAVYIRALRTFLNTKADTIIIPLASLASVFGFVLGWVPAPWQTTLVIPGVETYKEIIVYFGFAWLVSILLAMYRDIKNNPAHILFAIFFLFVAGMKLIRLDVIGLIGGLALFIIAALFYLVSTERLHPFGKVQEE